MCVHTCSYKCRFLNKTPNYNVEKIYQCLSLLPLPPAADGMASSTSMISKYYINIYISIGMYYILHNYNSVKKYLYS